VEELMLRPGMHHFMDITDHEFDDAERVVVALPLPTKPVQQALVDELLERADINIVTATLNQLSGFFTRYYRSQTGVQAAQWIEKEFQNWAFGRDDINVKFFNHTNFPQPSVIATIPGQGPNQKSVVIIGAHLDSIGSTTTGRSPGVDDDGTGTATILEIFRVLSQANYVPDFTLQFIGYAGEEAGLLGSQAIAANYLQNNVDVYAVLQLDMTGFNRNGQFTTGIITDFTNPDLNAFVRILVQTYTTLKLGNYQCGYACSDHASWNRTGFRSAFPFETPFGSNPSIHSANDVISILDTAQILQFVNLGIGFAVEVAGVAPEK